MTPSFAGSQGGLASTWNITSLEEAEHISETRFGIIGKATRFATEKDDTFRIVSASGESHVLKIANPDEAWEEVSFQVELLNHILVQDPGMPVPRVGVDRQGLQISPLQFDGGVVRFARMLTYMEGTPLDQLVTVPSERRKVGLILGRLRHATAGFGHSGDSRVLAWDVQHLPGLERLLVQIADNGRRAMLEEGFARFSTLIERIANSRQQVLHNDFSRSNIVVDKASGDYVTGIIDFGDSVRTAIAIDVSTALLNQLPTVAAPDLFLEGRDLLDGYLEVADLTDDELTLVPHLVMGRIIARALLTTWRASILPDNSTYILRNTEQGWSQLGWFLDRSFDEVSEALVRKRNWQR
ncbi:Ser/Thr protein kinase RdoA (MazF antagonist) [Rhizobium aquaticum]|uniref:Hydroxylysine kinase n=1 Tax=Rhizobium aquaticum TaxID=1549636 RepID=A0ABV2J623_9HYPH